MPKKTLTPEQIVAKLRQIEVLLSQGKRCRRRAKRAGSWIRPIRWAQRIQLEQARKLKDLQKENAQLQGAVADLTVEKQILKDIAEGNF